MQICQDHVGATEPEEADAHYRAVCRALVAEALELSSFLQKVSEGTNDLRQKTDTIASSEALDCLNFQDWVSVFSELALILKIFAVKILMRKIYFLVLFAMLLSVEY